MRGGRLGTTLVACALLTVGAAGAAGAWTEESGTVMLRGHEMTVHLYGHRGGTPILLSSGDGGWIHLGPRVAEMLAARGCFVVGFDAKAYLRSFTSGETTLRPSDPPSDYAALVRYAATGSSSKPILIGVSEGAGLSVLAAADPSVKPLISGVVGLGLPDRNELGWRWKDSLIYLTHGVPDEPTFSASEFVGRVAPVPLAAIHSTHDEFVSVADVRRTLERARQPVRLWVVEASDHRFSGGLIEFERRLCEALDWLKGQQPQ